MSRLGTSGPERSKPWLRYPSAMIGQQTVAL